MAEYKDLHTIRQYEFYGIKVLVEIDRIRKQVSLVEYNRADNMYYPKEYQFAGRELKYMNGWLNILKAMQAAVEAAKAELEQIKDEETSQTVELLMELKS